MNPSITTNPEYKIWLKDLKQKLRHTQLQAVVKVNSSLIEFYWHLGKEIVERQQLSRWGEGFLKQLSHDLMTEFPHIKGFSKRNLELIRQWYNYWANDAAITQQAVAQLVLIPWGHNQQIINKCKNTQEALFYVQNTLEHGWSRHVLTHQIESALYHREGNAINNFSQTLPAPQSDLAKQTLKDDKDQDAPTRGPCTIISHGPMPAVWPKGRTPLSPGGPYLSEASWSALRSLASVPSNEARRGIKST